MSSLALSVSMVYMEPSMSKTIVDENLLTLAHQHALDYLRMIPERPVAPQMTREELMGALSVPLSENGDDAAGVLDALAYAAERGTMGTTSPRFFGFAIGGSLP